MTLISEPGHSKPIPMPTIPPAIGDTGPVKDVGIPSSIPVDGPCFICQDPLEIGQAVKMIVCGTRGLSVAYITAAHQDAEDCGTASNT